MSVTIPDHSDTRPLTDARFAGTFFTGSDAGPVSYDGLPPGPRWPAALQTIALLRFRHRFHPWLFKTYGDTYTIRMLPAGRPLVFFTRPEMTKEIFAADPAIFHAGKGNAVLGPVMGEHSLLLQDGAAHQRARKLLMPAFNGAALRDYETLVTEIARAEVASWTPEVELPTLDAMNSLTLDVILRVVFGVTDEARLAALRPCVNKTVQVSPIVVIGWNIPRLRRFGPWKATLDNQYALDELMYAEIRERRTAPDLAERTDVLSRLIRAGEGGPAADRLSDTELRDQLVTLLLAGHETTATALAWALYELGRSPELLLRSQAAVDALADPEASDEAAHEAHAWLDAVFKESMRLHPVIAMVARTLQQPATIAGIDLPAGATVGPSIIVAHAREDNHPDPEVFRPDRFVGGNPPTNTWIPFGGGVRRCIGAGFAQMEGVAVLREVLAAYAVATVAPDEPKVRNITSVPRRGAQVKITAR